MLVGWQKPEHFDFIILWEAEFLWSFQVTHSIFQITIHQELFPSYWFELSPLYRFR